jgi:outer membrane protein OmpA-like peptidoglycan-associated protein
MAGSHDIRDDMQVIGSDGGMVGRVDGVDGDRIKLKRSPPGEGPHHFVPIAWVARVDEHVHLDRDAALVRDTWIAEGAGGTGTGTGTAPATGTGGLRGAAATDRPAGASKFVWIIGAILLLGILFLGFRAFNYAGREANYEDNAAGELTQGEREASGVASALPEGGTTAARASGMAGAVQAYLASTDAAPRSFIFDQLNFATSSAEIPQANRAELAQLGQALASGTSRVRIVGYADARGNAGANADLGQRRAEAVAAALAGAGVDRGRIEVASGGETNPEATNATAPGRGENRRTEMVILSR